MRSLRAVPWSVGALSLLAAGALGASAALASVPQALPGSLTTATPIREVPVAQRMFDDSRTVEVSLETGGERQVGIPISGVLTATGCRPGGTLTSGERIASVDGHSVTGLATGEPLWRDLEEGDTGDDVRALQTELSRLGHPVGADGIVGDATLAAAARLLDVESGTGDSPFDSIPVSAFAWLPSPTVSATSCPALLGGTVETGDALAALPVALTGGRIASTPAQLIDGARALVVGGVDAPVTRDLTISDPAALARIAATPEYAALTGGGEAEPTLPGTLALSNPLTAGVVPPASVYGLEGSTGCVASGGRAVRIRVVGSELGETFVVPVGAERLRRVSLAGERPSCR